MSLSQSLSHLRHPVCALDSAICSTYRYLWLKRASLGRKPCAVWLQGMGLSLASEVKAGGSICAHCSQRHCGPSPHGFGYRLAALAFENDWPFSVKTSKSELVLLFATESPDIAIYRISSQLRWFSIFYKPSSLHVNSWRWRLASGGVPIGSSGITTELRLFFLPCPIHLQVHTTAFSELDEWVHIHLYILSLIYIFHPCFPRRQDKHIAEASLGIYRIAE